MACEKSSVGGRLFRDESAKCQYTHEEEEKKGGQEKRKSGRGDERHRGAGPNEPAESHEDFGGAAAD